VSGRHHALYIATEGRLHGLAPESKVAATVAFIFAVVATPREAVWAFAVDLCIVFAVAAIGGVPIGHLVRRLTIEIPFLLFAVFLPFVGRPPNVEVLGLSLSEAGLWAAFGIVVKGSLGVLATVVLASTTSIPDILAGLERLRVPQVLVAITAFMIRYGDVVTDDLRRMRVARESRADDPRWIWQARAVASTAGTLFVRSYERGERVHQAMLARGYVGSMPRSDRTYSGGTVCFVPVVAAIVVAGAAWVVR
jgi:cobalt/nickel transport system permease protein